MIIGDLAGQGSTTITKRSSFGAAWRWSPADGLLNDSWGIPVWGTVVVAAFAGAGVSALIVRARQPVADSTG